MVDVKRLRELEAKATPGRWVCWGGCGWPREWQPMANAEIVWSFADEHTSTDQEPLGVTLRPEDQALIVWLRNNCAAILDAAERLEAHEAGDPPEGSRLWRCEKALFAAQQALITEGMARDTAERRVAELEIAIDVARKNESDAHHKRGEALEQLTAATARAEAAERARDEAVNELSEVREAMKALHPRPSHGLVADIKCVADKLNADNDAVAELMTERDEAVRRAEAYSKLLRMGETYSLISIVRELVAMCRICKDHHDSDQAGWEVRERALEEGESWLATLDPKGGK